MLHCQIFMRNGSKWFIPEDHEKLRSPRRRFASYVEAKRFFNLDLKQFINNANDDGWDMTFSDVVGFRVVTVKEAP